MKALGLLLLFIPVYFTILVWLASESPAYQAEQALIKQCHDLGGQMIRRTLLCVKPESLIIPIPR